MDAEGVAVDTQWGLLGHLDLREQIARGRIPSGEVDASRLTDQTAPAVAPDEVGRLKRLSVRQLDTNTAIILRETDHLASAVERHCQLFDPAGQNAFEMLLPQPEPEVVSGGEVADVQSRCGERRD